MPVLVVAVYDENGTVQCMNAAWGQICDTDKIALFLDPDHAKLDAIAFDQFRHGYYATGEKAGQAWNGRPLPLKERRDNRGVA